MAQTINDCPRRISPAVNTCGTLVWYFSFPFTLERSSWSKPNRSASVGSGPVNPRANNANSQGHSFSELGSSTKVGLPPSSFFSQRTFTVVKPFSLPSLSATNFLVMMLHSRWIPSSCDEVVLSLKGQNGHGWSSVRVSEGFGIISKLVTLVAPWRFDVPIQSEPVSPPPITTTFLLAAWSELSISVSPSTQRLLLGKKSIACTTPGKSDPGIGSLLRMVAPPQSTTASNAFSSSTGIFFPTSTPILNWIPSSSKIVKRRSITFFSILKSGIP